VIPEACWRAVDPSAPRATVTDVAAAVWAVTSTISGAPADAVGSRTRIRWFDATAGREAKAALLIVVAPDASGESVMVPRWKLDRIRLPVAIAVLHQLNPNDPLRRCLARRA
jgi:hypothetical protein